MEQSHDLGQMLCMVNRARVSFLQENEKYLRNVESIKRTSERMSAVTCQLRKIMDELALTRENIRSLEAEMNATAERFGI